jgi:uncharacterized membrane protein YfcA
MVIFLIALSALVMEAVDTGIGMMYGTLLTPFLVLCGCDPKVVVPSILLSQALGGFMASWQHHRTKNASLAIHSRDFKIAATIVLLGVFATFMGAFTGAFVSKTIITIYIGILVFAMGILVIWNPSWKFSWAKIVGLGTLSSFNKALSGGGFGPIIVSGQILTDRPGKNAIGTTDFAEAPVCLMGFLTWLWFNHSFPEYHVLVPLCIGAMIGGIIGPNILSKVGSNKTIIKVVGWTAVALGVLTLVKVFT